jgi:hypothetical protein
MLQKTPTRPKVEKTRPKAAPLKSDPATGLSRDILDEAFWRKDHEPDDAWVAALDRLDRLGDKKPLQDLLRVLLTDHGLPKVGEHLAHLIERGIPSPKGRPKKLSYRPSRKEDLLMLAMDYVKALIENGMPKDAALEKIAAEHGYRTATLIHAFNGKRGSLSRSRKRL